MNLHEPLCLVGRDEVLSKPCPVPKVPGLYAWYFKEVPPGVPVDGCISVDGLTLLYIGISPREVPKNGKPASRQRLFNRVRYHFQGNAEGSTLRLTLGCLLAERLGIELRRVGSGTRMTFGAGEAKLSAWMRDNARVAWHEHDEPWVMEAELIRTVALPLNLHMNDHHPFRATLSQIRRAAKANARVLAVV